MPLKIAKPGYGEKGKKNNEEKTRIKEAFGQLSVRE